MDVGLEVIEFAKTMLAGSDDVAKWTEPIDRGFKWWSSDLCQTIWAEPVFVRDGVPEARIHIRTPLVRDVDWSRGTYVGLNGVMGKSSMCGLVAYPDPTYLLYAASVTVREATFETASWLSHVISCQATQARWFLTQFLPRLGSSRVRKKAEIFLSARSSLEVEALR